MGEYVFLSNYLKDSEGFKSMVNYLQSQRFQFQIRTAYDDDGQLISDYDSIFIIYPKGYDNIIDIFDRREVLGGIPVYRRFVELYEDDFKIKINNFLKVLSNKRSLKSFNYTKSRGILMLVVEVDEKVACIPSHVILKLNKSFDAFHCKVHEDRIVKIANTFGCDIDELRYILNDELIMKYGEETCTLITWE